MPHLSREGDVFVLDLGADENRFNPGWVEAVTALVEEVVQAEGPRALVTSATGKFWSNGLDLEWMAANQEAVPTFIPRVQELFARVLEAGVFSVAAIQGHCFAAGAMLATAHDFRVMREDRGFLCYPEIDIGLPFTPGMSALLQARLPKRTAHEAMTTGRRYGGVDALAAGIVDQVAPEADVLPRAVALAGSLAGKSAHTLAAIKLGMYGPALEALRQPL